MPISITRSPDYIFNLMAKTIREPVIDQPDTYWGSCFNKVARSVATGLLSPDHEIVLLGTQDVYHAVVVAGDTLLVDAMNVPGVPEPKYNHKLGIWSGRFNRQPQDLYTLDRITVADFYARYVNTPAP
jgi:hypothetical protein